MALITLEWAVLTTADISVFLSTLILLQALLEILIAGGLLAPGGSIQQDGDKGPVSTSACIFQVPIPVFVKLLALPWKLFLHLEIAGR